MQQEDMDFSLQAAHLGELTQAVADTPTCQFLDPRRHRFRVMHGVFDAFQAQDYLTPI